MSERARKLTPEERVLWHRVAKSAAPLKGKRLEPFAEPRDPDLAQPLPPERPMPTLAERTPEKKHLPKPGFDRTTRQKLAKGRLPIEGRVDLHGLTQAEAYLLLQSFLHQAYAEGLRHVLVITGKGSSLGSDGILKRAVPDWLATPPFRAFVAGYDAAARGHGGSGALYVRLRRP